MNKSGNFLNISSEIAGLFSGICFMIFFAIQPIIVIKFGINNSSDSPIDEICYGLGGLYTKLDRN